MIPVQPRRDLNSWWTVAPDPGKHALIGKVKECPQRISHEAQVFVREGFPGASFHHARDARCRFCGDSVPIQFRDQGSYDPFATRYSSRDGSIHPGNYFWMFRPGIPTSKEATRFLDKNWKNHEMHLIVCLPDGNLWDSCAAMEEDGFGGWDIRGDLPNISTSPAVKINEWEGSIQEGVFVDRD